MVALMTATTVTTGDGEQATAHDPGEWMTTAQARAWLDMNHRRFALLIARGLLRPQRNVFDKRQRLVRRADVEAIRRDGVDGMRKPSWAKGE